MSQGNEIKYLLDYKHGRIKKGLPINCDFDNYWLHKKSNLNIILGHDNVGKSIWIFWYFLNLCLRNDLKVCLYAGENQKGQILRDLIQMYSGVKFANIPDDKIRSYCMHIEQYFEFIPNNKIYTPEELLTIFKDSDCQIGLIDPFTALKREYTYSGNYEFLNLARQFVNDTGMTIYINTHPISESGRSGALYPANHEWSGSLRMPLKSEIEGGKSFLNRCDNMLVLHRLIKNESMKYYTMLSTEKIKDLDSGGNYTPLDQPALFEFNSGLGFKIAGKDPLSDLRPGGVISNSFPVKTETTKLPF
tara:strand:+ start:20390 stop:21301 length:912 start_codon:yes stop_codon:yes gene_type:complete